ncbi:MAG: acetylxylan esterase, partial [Lentisphaeria bacterium]|nr:acetylxylan esterase [Lentisphaeria bacterium]
MDQIPAVWNMCAENPVRQRMTLEAQNRFREFSAIPCDNLKDWQSFRTELRKTLWEKLGSVYDRDLPLDYKEYGTIDCGSYKIRKITYRSTKEMLVTANLFVPEGEGPFPAVVAVHGHWAQGKIAERVQCRGHLLASNGYVVLSVDAFGAGERGSVPGEFEYHGGALGGSVFHIGESLMGCQIRENMRGVDLLVSLPFVDPEKIGVTGASGGGNQTMWLGAMDDRIKASVPVVSVGTFESYVENRNCVCELLVDGLTFTEESAILALAAPNAMLIMNATGDINGAFAVKEMLRSYQNAKK